MPGIPGCLPIIFQVGLPSGLFVPTLPADRLPPTDRRPNPGISFAADLGFYYQNDVNVGSSDGEWALGASITNMGTPVSYTADAAKTPIPTNLRIGGRFTYNIDDYNSISAHLDINKFWFHSTCSRD